MALATTTTPGSVILGGDLTGVANAPELRVTGVVAGTYTYPTIVVDAKGRLIYAHSTGLTGDVTGVRVGLTVNTTLASVNATPGTYPLPSLTVDSKGRVTEAESQVLAGDISGPYTATVLATVPGANGTYTHATIAVDSKGRVTAGNSNSNILAGEVYNTIANSILGTTSVTAGTYSLASMTIRSDGRLSAASTNAGITFTGDVSGTSNALTLNDLAGASVGSFTAATMTIDSKGRVSTATAGTSTAFVGQMTGTVGATTLQTVGGLFTGTYTYATITVGNKGLISAITNNTFDTPPDATDTVSGLVQISPIALNVTAGSLAVNLASDDTTYGVVASANTSNIALSSGQVDIGPNIPSLLTTSTFTKSQELPALEIAGTVAPDTLNYDMFVATGYINPLPPTDLTNGTTFSITGTSLNVLKPALDELDFDGNPYLWQQPWPEDYPSKAVAVWNGSFWCTLSYGAAQTSTDGLNWSAGTPDPFLGVRASGIAWNGSIFCAIGGANSCGTSTDGITWSMTNTLPSLGGSFKWRDLVWNGSVFCAVGETVSSEFTAKIATSTDGITWTEYTHIPSSPIYSSGEASNNSCRIIAAGSKMVIFFHNMQYVNPGFWRPVCLVSTNNGVSWTDHYMDISANIPGDQRLGQPAWNGTYFVTCVSKIASGGVARCYRSTDGITWTSANISATIPVPIDAVVAVGSKFYAFTSYSQFESVDNGVTWTVADITRDTLPIAIDGGASGSQYIEGITCAVSNGSNIFVGGGHAYYTSGFPNDPSSWGLLGTCVISYTKFIAPAAGYKFSNTTPLGHFTLNCVVTDSIVYGTYSD